MLPSQAGLQPIAWKKWLPLGILGLVAVLAGVVLPQTLPDNSLPERVEAPASSTNNLTYTPPAWPEPPNHQAMFLRLGLGTLIVLALCAGTIYASKRWLKPGPASTTAHGQLRLVETLALGQRCWVHLVNVGQKPVLIGGDATGVKTVTPLPESFAEALLSEAEDAAATREPQPGELRAPKREGA